MENLKDFYKKERALRLPETATLSVYLILDNWNDFHYRTLYQITLFDEHGTKHDLGHIKIANFGQTTEERIELPQQFEALDEQFFSLGQSVDYYEIIQSLSSELKELLLVGLRDIIFDEKLQLRALEEEVTKISLLRDTSLTSIKGQYKRVLDGGAILTEYNFEYETKKTDTEAGFKLEFNVNPESNPPTNIHVLISRNGVGKTQLLNNMVKTLMNDENSKGKFKQIKDEGNDTEEEFFSGVVSVSYSAFDPFKPYPENPNQTEGFRCSYIGLKKIEEEEITLKNHNELADEFFMSIEYCFSVGKKEKWKNAVENLESDNLFAQINLTRLLDENLNKRKILRLFKKLSSGHAIVLITITKLVEKIEEKTLVLLDEPEGHLHPPLLSAFIRALSDLLKNRNAVAIIATHSPVIAQEVPKSCVSKLSRFGLEAKAERPDIETFGENISTLTREIFSLEVAESGFHKLLKHDVEDGKSYEQIIDKYNNQLGFEAKLLLRALLIESNRQEAF